VQQLPPDNLAINASIKAIKTEIDPRQIDYVGLYLGGSDCMSNKIEYED
jgi:hypothetical protein